MRTKEPRGEAPAVCLAQSAGLGLVDVSDTQGPTARQFAFDFRRPGIGPGADGELPLTISRCIATGRAVGPKWILGVTFPQPFWLGYANGWAFRPAVETASS